MTDRQDLIARLKLLGQELHGFEKDAVDEAIELIHHVESLEYVASTGSETAPMSSRNIEENELWEFVRHMMRNRKSTLIGYTDTNNVFRYTYSGEILDRVYMVGMLYSLQIAALSKIVTKPTEDIPDYVTRDMQTSWANVLAHVIANTPVASTELVAPIIDGDTGKHPKK